MVEEGPLLSGLLSDSYQSFLPSPAYYYCGSPPPSRALTSSYRDTGTRCESSILDTHRVRRKLKGLSLPGAF